MNAADEMTGTLVEREIAIQASPETVWGLLVDPEKAVRWMGVSVSFDPTPGGRYRVDVLPGSTASGVFVEIDPPRRLVHTFGWEPGPDGPNAVAPGSSTVEYELVPDGSGTLLRFRHHGLPNVVEAERHGHGWDHYLGRLAASAVGDAGPDPWLEAVS